MKFLLLFATLLVAAAASNLLYESDDIIHKEWNLFKLKHRKNHQFSALEENFKKNVFIENWHYVTKHNTKYELGLVNYTLKLNQFADMFHHEMSQLNGFNQTTRHQLYSSGFVNNDFVAATFIPPANVKVPESMDWRKEGAVTPVKDQGHCGSCWAFSTTGSLEGQHFRKTGVLVSLSEQNLVDCSSKYGNNGCDGGMMDYAFQYIRDNRGLDTEKTYPYEAHNDRCRYNPRNSGATDAGYVDIPQGDEEKLKIAVATIGPISVAIDASHQSFQFYSEGVYSEPECSSENLDHGVLVVGYGTTEKGEDYWLVKNSWSETWGDRGYIKMARNKDNMCGIATSASYPLV